MKTFPTTPRPAGSGFLLAAALGALLALACAGAHAAQDLSTRSDLVPGYTIDLSGTHQTFAAGADGLPGGGVAVAQQGNGNRARTDSGERDGLALAQQGSGNEVALRQSGSGNAAALMQSGSDNSVSAVQGGSARLRVEQSGSRISADVVQGAGAPPLTIRQTGGGTYARVRQY